MGDNSRSGRSPIRIRPDPSGKPTWVYHSSRPPAPAWPETAPSDHWRKRSTPETPKTTFDWVHDVTVADGKVFFGSSADDTVRCLDAATGRRLWSFHAGGPVRLAPSLHDGRVVFGCDDGAVYSLDAATGALHWKTMPGEDKRLPGNGRIINRWPVRTGILTKDNTGYFGAGLFPGEGTFYCTVDLRNGRIIDKRAVDFSPQGYVYQSGDKLLAQSGRAKSDEVLGTVKTPEHPTTTDRRTRNTAQKKYPFGKIETPEHIFVGGEKTVAAFKPDGEKPIWEAAVDGPARGLAIAEGTLYVSTTTGSIYAFGSDSKNIVNKETAEPAPVLKRPRAGNLIAQLPRNRGYALVIGVGDGGLIQALAQNSQLQVVGIDTDNKRIGDLRKRFESIGIYGAPAGDRGGVSIQLVDNLDTLPFVDGIFNLVTTGDSTTDLSEKEAERLVRPWDGLATSASGKVLLRGTAPKGAGAWTHAYADPGNTASSGDLAVDGEVAVRWFGRPGPERIVDRHLRAPPPLSAGGYLLIPGRDYLFGLDAHNGTVLWERAIPRFMRASMLRDCGNLVLDPATNSVFAASGAQCLVLDVESGEARHTFSVNPETEEWGYLAMTRNVLIGSAVKKGAIRRELSYAAIWEGGYGDGKRAVCSHRLFALDPGTGKQIWSYQPEGAIANPSICIEGGYLMFLESRNVETLKPSESKGRWNYADLIKTNGADIVALELSSGKPAWRRSFGDDATGIQTLFLSAASGHLVMVYSRNLKPKISGNSSERPTLHYQVRVLEVAGGASRWDRLINTNRNPNLTHGEQDLHPVIAGDRLVVEPTVFDLESGKELFTFKRQGGGGCGTLSAAANKLYFRASNVAEFDLVTRRQDWITRTTRPGCWISMIPANGLLLVPEGSSGCICSYPVQASMGFGPIGSRTGNQPE